MFTCLAVPAIITGFLNLIRMLPFALEAQGFSPQFSAQCISCVFVSSTFSRGLVVLVADQPWFSRRHFMIGGAVLASSCSLGEWNVNKVNRVIWKTRCLTMKILRR